MKQFFEKEGLALEMEGKSPLPLGDESLAWFVSAGRVDIFAITPEPEEAEGARRHLVRLEKDRLILGLNALGTNDLQLVAVGVVGTRLFQIKLSRFMELAGEAKWADSAARLLGAWLEGLSLAVRTRLMPRNAIELQTATETKVEAGNNVHAAGGPLWASHLEGESLFMGREDLPAIGPNLFFPLFKQSWLNVTSAGILKCIDSLEYFRSDPTWSAVRAFHRMILQCAALNIQAERRNEEERLRSRAELDRLGMEAALRQLTSVLSPIEAAGLGAEAHGDPLLMACQMVGEACGIDMRAPPAPTDGQGAGDRLSDIARASGVRMRQVALRDDWWRGDNGPLLAFVQETKAPVALIPVSARIYELNSPGILAKVKIDENVAATLEPMAHMFYRPFPEHPISPKEFLRFGLRGCRGDLTSVVLMGASGALLGLIFPIITGIIMDSVIPEAARGRLLQIVMILLSCAVASAMFDITKKIALLRVEANSDISMQAALWDRLMSLPASFFRRFSSGDLAVRSLGINSIRQILSGVTVNTILTSLFSIFNFFLLFYYDWELALVATGLAILGICFTGTVSLFKVKHQRRVNEIQGRIQGVVLQFITGIAKLRVAGAERRAFRVWAKMFENQKKLAFRAGIIQGVIETFNATFPILASMAIFAWMIFGEVSSLSTGEFIAFNTAYTSFQNALLQMAVVLAASLNVVPLYERLNPIIQELPEIDAAKAHPGELSGAIEVNHIKFRYSPGGPLILNDVSFSVRPGEFIALVGQSGSGKSTMFRLLLGFETPESGTIYYDGQDLATIDIGEVRRQIGVVLQNAKVMPGEIYKSIVGASNLTLDDAWEAARMAGLEEDIKSMPMGMNTMVSAGGATFSGGQRQRLLIARAIVKKPRILFFDEATSALDNKTQAVVSGCLESLKATRVVIAHRLSTVIHADRILVLDAGRIVEVGTYEELMAGSKLFAELAKRQIS